MGPGCCTTRGAWKLATLLAVACAAGALADGGRDHTPAELAGIGVEERLDLPLPLDLRFVDDNGRDVRLGDYFGRGRPVIITFNYFECPTLCSYQLNGLVDGMQRMTLVPGKDYEIVTISFDPLETWRLARAKKRSYVQLYGSMSADGGWHFLTGRKAEIKALTAATGFNYQWNAKEEQWAHSATAILCTPDGRTSRYLGGVLFDPRVLRLSLVEASEGRIGTLWDQVFLTCYHYVSSEGRYVPAAFGMMRLGGGVSVAVLGAVLLGLWRFDVRRQRLARAAAA